MNILGITGPTGAGKTTLLHCVEEMGGCVLDLDAVYHRLLKTNSDLLRELDERFPGTVGAEGLDRKALGAIVFADPEAMEALNRITGFYIRAETDRLLAEAERNETPLAAIDAINLLESELRSRCDVSIAVVAPVETRVRRIMERDGIPEAYARSRIQAQRPNEYYSEGCQYTLVNDVETIEEFAAKCRKLLYAVLDKLRYHVIIAPTE